VFGLADVPIIGPIVFGQDIVVYAGVALLVSLAWMFRRTKLGLIIRAVGESPTAARDVGYSVIGIRFASVAFGGLLAGIGGAYLSTAYTALWTEGLVAGRGWIAVALVVFGSWIPLRIAVGAYIFGAISLLELSIQGLGLYIPSQALSALPYVVTIAVLAVISRDATYLRLNRPIALGKTFRGEG
jgi:general nucleoside transport system permease protein